MSGTVTSPNLRSMGQGKASSSAGFSSLAGEGTIFLLPSEAKFPAPPQSSGCYCIKICFPGKLILSKNKSSINHISFKVCSENQFSRKKYYNTMARKLVPYTGENYTLTSVPVYLSCGHYVYHIWPIIFIERNPGEE